jgi:hypothetical protein
MEKKFSKHYLDLSNIYTNIPQYSKKLFKEIIDSTHLLYLRARLVHSLYDYEWGIATNQPSSFLIEKKNIASNTLSRAQIVF